MADNYDQLALRWVKEEVEKTLTDTQKALEAYVAEPEDVTRLRTCVTYLHQVRGTLQMLEFYGAALLAEEMEQLTEAILNEDVRGKDEALDVLMGAILQLPPYLERVQSGQQDMPLVLLPLLNDLRAARGQNLLTESSIFTPDLSQLETHIDLSLAQNPLTDEQVQERTRKLRHHYQKAMLGIFRNVQVPDCFQYLHKVAEHIHEMSLGLARQRLWWVVRAFMHAIEHNGSYGSASVKVLLGDVERLIKELQEHGNEALNRPIPLDQLKNLLYHIASTRSKQKIVDEVQQFFSLKDALPTDEQVENARQKMGGPDQRVIGSVVVALKEDIANIKDTLDLAVRQNTKNPADLESVPGAIRRVSDTLALLGLGAPRDIISQQYEMVEQLISGELEMSDAAIMDIAGSLLYVEATLAGIAQSDAGLDAPAAKSKPVANSLVNQVEYQLAYQALMREARVNLQQSKDAIVDFIGSNWNFELLQPVIQWIAEVSACLELVDNPRPSTILLDCGVFIDEYFCRQNRIPKQSTLDALADALTGVEYYLEHIEMGARGSELLLDSAAESVQSIQSLLLGQESAEEEDAPPEFTFDAPDGLDDDEIPSLQFIEERDEVVLTADERLPETAPVSTTPTYNISDELVDNEVIEIFIEEAREELARLNELQPLWIANNDNTQALQDFRRSYHTLKGSGRLVKAVQIGELAWSMENLVNRVIDKSVAPSQAVFETIEKARYILPEMIDAFVEHRQTTADVEPLMQRAHALSRNETDVAVTAKVTPSGAAVPIRTQTKDTSLLDIFKEEAKGLLATIGQFVNQAALGSEVSKEVIAAFHTIKGSAGIAGLTQFAQIAGVMENAWRAHPVLDKTGLLLLQDTYQFIYAHYSPWLEGHLANAAECEALIARIEAFETGSPSRLQSLLPFMELASDTLASLDTFYKQADLLVASSWHKGLASLTSLASAAPTAEVPDSLQALLNCYADYMQYLSGQTQPIKNTQIDLALQCHDQLTFMLDNLAADQPLHAPQALFDLVEKVMRQKVAKVAQSPVEEAEQDAAIPVVTESVELTNLDPELLEIFFEESAEILERCNENLALWEHDLQNKALLAQLQRDLHTLKGSARMTQIFPIGDLTHCLEDLYEALVNEQVQPSTELFNLMQVSQYQLEDMVAACRQGIAIPVNRDLVEHLTQFSSHAPVAVALEDEIERDEASSEVVPVLDATVSSAETVADKSSVPASKSAFTANERYLLPDSVSVDMLSIFLDEARDIFDRSSSLLDTWQGDLVKAQPVAELQRHLHTIKGGARMVEIEPVADLAHSIEDLYQAIVQQQVKTDTALFDLIQLCHDRLIEMVESIATQNYCTVASDLVDLLQETVKQALRGAPVADDLASRLIQPLAIQKNDEVLVQSGVLTPLAEQELIQEEQLQLDEDAEETLSIYLPEAQELIENVAELLQIWTTDRANSEYTEALKRNLHTLKGGARLVQLTAIAEISHGLEILFAQNEDRDLDEEQLELAYEAMETLTHLLKLAETERKQEWPYGLLHRLGIDKPVAPALAKVSKATPAAERKQPVSIEKAAEMQQKGDAGQPLAQAQQEFVRVRSDLLDGMVNLAGETSIARGRIEQQFLQVRYNLKEMESTIDRLRELLRRMEIETETEIMSSESASSKGQADFDPLEMDRYSHIYQISRSLSESANDLLSLKDNMDSLTGETEALLLQQARINTELQEGLMQARMIPFSSLVPRLRRMVRQIGGELHKPVQLAISAEGEMDRTVLERMVAPLEHMIRNAIDHGIEDQSVRERVGKPEAGLIKLRLFREGSHIVIELSDDGAGINLDAIRNKAIERGIINNSSQLSEPELLQLIFDAGFSTATKVTQISGRGVGMDVVHSEIKQLGGDIEIQSTFGAGTRFTIRLPFTVSVNQALMVRVADEHYAIPLTSISGIVEIHPAELQVYFASDSPGFEYAGQYYTLRYAGDVLGINSKPHLTGLTKALPILLLHGSDMPVALLVDELNGSREITVKSVGPQLANVPGLSGATILGDGRVVLILDLAGMLRHEKKMNKPSQAVSVIKTEVVQQDPLVMVVDDSITVRKVTSRLLERNGYRVITAKDGVDAVNVLHETVPDIMLLDIEMPRMDGFEFASFVRHDERFMNIPIIMITSRTGAKHRARAEDIGVNHYMGKPFQEAELLEKLAELVYE